MKLKLVTTLCFFLVSFQSILKAQEIKLPIEFKSGHLFSEWKLNDSIRTRVMLETAFPKVVISESYALRYLKGLVKLKKAPENTAIGLWGKTNKTKVSYLIKDTLQFNGRRLFVDALVADVSNIKSWKNRDIVFPLKDLPGISEINIKEQYMIIDRYSKDFSGYFAFDVTYDDGTKGLYLETNLHISDSLQTKEALSGKFIFDLGAPNAIFVNRVNGEVEDFIEKSDRMILKDTTRFKPNPRTNLAIIMPKKINIDKISLSGEYIIAMKLFGQQSQKYVGVIGNRFFRHFVVVFDFKNNKIYLKPNSEKVNILNDIRYPNR